MLKDVGLWILLAFTIISGCAALVERDATVKAPRHYEDNRVFTTVNGVDLECRKDVKRPNDPYHMVNGQPTFCLPPGQWPDQRR